MPMGGVVAACCVPLYQFVLLLDWEYNSKQIESILIVLYRDLYDNDHYLPGTTSGAETAGS